MENNKNGRQNQAGTQIVEEAKSIEELRRIFAKNLAYYMDVQQRSRDDIVYATRTPYSTVCDWVNGSKYPRMNKIEQLAFYFGIKKSDLIEEKSKNSSATSAVPDEIWEMRAILRQKPSVKVLFDMSKDAKEKDVKKAIKILEMMQEDSY